MDKSPVSDLPILGYVPQEQIASLKGIQPIRIYPFDLKDVPMQPVCLLSAAKAAIDAAMRMGTSTYEYTDAKGNVTFLSGKPSEWNWITVRHPLRRKSVVGPFRLTVIPLVKSSGFSWTVDVRQDAGMSLRWRGKESDEEPAKAAAVKCAIKCAKSLRQQQRDSEVFLTPGPRRSVISAESNSSCPLPPKQDQWHWMNVSSSMVGLAEAWVIVIRRTDLCWDCSIYGPKDNGATPHTVALRHEKLQGCDPEEEIKQSMVDIARTVWFDIMVEIDR